MVDRDQGPQQDRDADQQKARLRADVADDLRAGHASYGTYCVMWQIEQTKTLKLPHLYLGYWIAESPKMAYKNQFRPHQLLVDGQWSTPSDEAS